MDLATIEMPRVEARRAYLEYRQVIRDQRDRELDEVRSRQLVQDRAIRDAYRQLSIGNQVIRLEASILSAGFDDRGRPRLAVCRADVAEGWFQRTRAGRITFMASEDAHRNWESRVMPRKRIQFQGPGDDSLNWSISGVSTLPNIPPAFRPDHHLRNYHLLWEAEWREVRSSRALAPRDPALLKHLSGDLWAVLGVWDLTDVERSALESGRLG